MKYTLRKETAKERFERIAEAYKYHYKRVNNDDIDVTFYGGWVTIGTGTKVRLNGFEKVFDRMKSRDSYVAPTPLVDKGEGFTQGDYFNEWNIDWGGDGINQQPAIYGKSGSFICNVGIKVKDVSEIDNGNVYSAETKANARLISQSPAMYRALKELLYWYNEVAAGRVTKNYEVVESAKQIINRVDNP